jgi:hypothetical protein
MIRNRAKAQAQPARRPGAGSADELPWRKGKGEASGSETPEA